MHGHFEQSIPCHLYLKNVRFHHSKYLAEFSQLTFCKVRMCGCSGLLNSNANRCSKFLPGEGRGAQNRETEDYLSSSSGRRVCSFTRDLSKKVSIIALGVWAELRGTDVTHQCSTRYMQLDGEGTTEFDLFSKYYSQP